MSALQKRYRIRGLGMERLLDSLQKAGINLYDIRRDPGHSVTFSCDASKAAQVETAAQSLGFAWEALPPQGLARRLAAFRQSIGLWGLALIAMILLLLSLQFVWHIEIDGAGIYQGEVRALLREQNIHPGVLRASIDTQALCDALLYRLPHIAWARAQVRGVTLQIDITQGIPTPKIESSGAVGNIIAAQDGVIVHIDVYSGTAAVKAGDTIRAGDVLIYGRERNSLDGEVRSVHARGTVMAQVYLQAEADLPAFETRSNPTGNMALQRVFASPWVSYALDGAPDYLTSDMETERIPLGGAWWPLWYEKRMYHEVALEEIPRDPDALYAEAGALAMQKLLLLCGNDDEIIDKKLNFRMIEGDTIRVTATALLHAQIGMFAPQSDQ